MVTSSGSLNWLFSLAWRVRYLGAVQTLAHVLGISGLENHIQYSAAGAEAPGNSLRRVVIEMMLLHVAEIRTLEIVVVRRVVNPLFSDVGLERTGKHHRSRKGRKEKDTQRRAYQKERQHVAHLAAHVIAVKGSFVMPEVKRVKILIRQTREKLLVPLLRNLEMTVQDIAMRKIFDKHPEWNPADEEEA